MTQEEKNLLTKDLCARLPYGVIVDNPNPVGGMWDEVINIDTSTKTVILLYDGRVFSIDDVKPYLRPMSSMTEEERKELKNTTCPNGTGYVNEKHLVCPVNHFGEQISFDFMADIVDWLVSHHFDFRGLIEKGLALEALDGMYEEATEGKQ